MRLEYLNYELEQLFEEKLFVSYLLRDENAKAWEEFLNVHPGFNAKLKEARELLGLLEVESTFDNKDYNEMWHTIMQSQEKEAIKISRINRKRFLSLAASVLLFISLGTAGVLFLTNQNQEFRFSAAENGSTESRIILSTGDEIKLSQDHSTIVLNDSAQKIAVNDTVIDLDKKSNLQKSHKRLNEITIPYGQKSELLLADGTKVWLNAGSRFAFPTDFSGKNREVYLEGEACFDVVENKSKPFVVKTGNLDIKVLGTHFNVSAYPEDETVETVLLQGSVALSKPSALGFNKKNVVLIPNQKARFQKEAEEFTVTDEPDVEFSVAWTYGYLHYTRESLHSVLRRVQRYYNVEVEISEDYPTDDEISGKLNLNESVEEVIAVLSVASGFDYSISDEKILIKMK